MIINQNSPHSTILGWQTFLNTQNCNAGKPDGIWGPNTELGSKEFQSSNGLKADGIPGPNTLAVAEKKGFVIPHAGTFNPPGTTNTIFDISHNQANVNLSLAKGAGMEAVFHKASEGHTLPDNRYAQRKVEAKEAGLLWGAYHFGHAGNVNAQVDFFLDCAQAKGDTLLVLDFEPDMINAAGTMSLEDARTFVSGIYAKTGKYPGLYGGSLIKKYLPQEGDSVLSKCWLWLSEYGPKANLPNGWSQYTLWQYTSGNIGPGQVPVDGVGLCDRDLFNGTSEQLRAFWASHVV